MMMSEIETKHIIAWQNELLAYRDEFKKPYSATYLKTVHNQLVAILNHAVRHYGLKSNPASKVGCIGSKEREEMNFWTKEEYMKFAEVIMDKPMSYYAFEMLYWCGIREGEMLAITPADFNFTKKTVRINKTYQRIHGQDLITSPKTRKSVRTVEMPDFLCDEMQDYIKSLYKVQKNDRIFPITKSYLQHEMSRGSKEAGVKRIRIFEEHGGTYTLGADGMLYPNLILEPQEHRPIGRWGRMHRAYLETEHPGLYERLILNGTLDRHLADAEERAKSMLERLIGQMARQEGITEGLKASDQLEWVQRMNSIRSRAEEIVQAGVINTL
jgi:hypothetical protein